MPRHTYINMSKRTQQLKWNVKNEQNVAVHKGINSAGKVKYLSGGVGVSVTGRGVVTEKDYVAAFMNCLTRDNQKLEKYMYCLADWTAVSKVEISTEAIEYIAWLSKNALTVKPDIVIASVADQDIMFGLTRMAHALRDGADCENEIFQNRQDAEEWIREKVKKHGIDDPKFRLNRSAITPGFLSVILNK